MFKALRGSLRTRREDFVDRVYIRLFLRITRRAPLCILWEFRKELHTAITKRLAEDVEPADRDKRPANELSILCR